MFENYNRKECFNCDEKKYIRNGDELCLDCHKLKIVTLETKIIGVRIKLKQ
jgi:hypothetical protein